MAQERPTRNNGFIGHLAAGIKKKGDSDICIMELV